MLKCISCAKHFETGSSFPVWGFGDVRLCMCVLVGGGGGMEQRHVTEEILRPIPCRFVLIE